MNFETLIALTTFTQKAITWSETNEALTAFRQIGLPVPQDIQDAFDILGENLDQDLRTAPPEVVVLA
tara:strand:- start:4763 stop:4963 length:201 start_codon:yes stop_codon:yes gene_type:complete